MACNTTAYTDAAENSVSEYLHGLILESKDIDEVLDGLAGHAAFRFKQDPFYSNGFVPTVKQLVDRILTGA